MMGLSVLRDLLQGLVSSCRPASKHKHQSRTEESCAHYPVMTQLATYLTTSINYIFLVMQTIYLMRRPKRAESDVVNPEGNITQFINLFIRSVSPTY